MNEATAKPDLWNGMRARWRAFAVPPLVRRIFSEPLTHFVLAGAVLFLISGWIEQQTSRYRIEVGQEQIARLAAVYEQQYGAPPSEAQLALLLDRWLQEEILFREAQALGLDRDDEIVRRRMVQKYQFLQQDVAAARAPSEAQLQAFYRANPALYTEAAQRTFSHLYFSADRDGEAGARRRAEAALAQAQQGASPPAADVFSGPAQFAALDAAGVQRVFGGEGFAGAVFAAPVGRWSGPYRSGLGWHIVRVESETSGGTAAFADVEARVRADYEAAQRRAANDAAMARLRARYTIVDRTGRR